MKAVFYLFIVLFLSSCAKEKSKGLEIEGFESYVDSFELEAAERNVSFKIVSLKMKIVDGLNKLQGAPMGFCHFENGAPIIRIDKWFWEHSSDESKEKVVFHELGHCVLRRDHIKTFDEAGNPTSLMYPKTVAIPKEHYKAYREEYLDELFLNQ